jgi:carbamoyltransferase
MFILGWHGGIRREWHDMGPGWSTHDGAAVLLKNGAIVAAVEEERLNRVKHSNFFPAYAIRRCLDLGGVEMAEVDVVAMNFSERIRRIFPADAGLPSVDLFLEDPGQSSSTVRHYVREMFLREFGADVSGKLFFCGHHVAHLWSAWGPSGLGESLVVSLDGSGDGLSGMVAIGSGDRIESLREYSVAQSLGNLYSDCIRLLGYRRFDEYKVMGLAPYGSPERFSKLFASFFELLTDGDYRLIDREERWGLIHDAGLLPMARRSGEPFSQVHRDFAAALQQTLETIVLHVLTYFGETTGQRNLCYAGGVAHNCSLNGKILYTGMFDTVFVQPAAHDAGGALGAAIRAACLHGGSRGNKLTHVFLGADIPPIEEIESTLSSWAALLEFERLDDVPRVAAELLAGGAVVGWVQGRSEFGPRALGHRSILADPRPATNKGRINQMVKKREAYRPFAPSVLKECLAEVARLPVTEADYSFMTFALPVLDSVRDKLSAVTHVDGTARVQSVSRETDPRYWQLIQEFHALTGVPALLNTSFNNDAEPIVESIRDAIVCYLTTNVDLLIVGDYLIRRLARGDAAVVQCISALRPSMPTSRKLVRRFPGVRVETESPYSIELTSSRHFGEARVSISKDSHTLLLKADGRARLGHLLSRCHIETESRRAAVANELLTLWRRRAIILDP